MKYQRTVTFSKSNDSQEKVKIRPIIRSPTTSPSSGGRGRKSHHEAGGCNRQHDVKMELQLNKVHVTNSIMSRCWRKTFTSPSPFRFASYTKSTRKTLFKRLAKYWWSVTLRSEIAWPSPTSTSSCTNTAARPGHAKLTPT